jgi:hypothetical protein
VARRFVNSRDTALGSHCDGPFESRLTPADELFFNLDGRVVSAEDDEWRLEVCGVHSMGTQHWIQLKLHGLVGWGVTLRTDTLSATGVLDRVSAWLRQAMPSDERWGCTVAD